MPYQLRSSSTRSSITAQVRLGPVKVSAVCPRLRECIAFASSDDERAGIGCVLESTSDRSIRVSVIVNGGAAQFSDIREGDVLESINGQQLGQGVTVEACSEYIRGPAGSYVQVRTRMRLKCVLLAISLDPACLTRGEHTSLASADRTGSVSKSASSERQFPEARLRFWVPCSRALALWPRTRGPPPSCTMRLPLCCCCRSLIRRVPKAALRWSSVGVYAALFAFC